jgi:hypothetical protein
MRPTLFQDFSDRLLMGQIGIGGVRSPDSPQTTPKCGLGCAGGIIEAIGC